MARIPARRPKQKRRTPKGTSPQQHACLERRARVSALYLREWTQPRIAAELGISQPTVCRDIAAIEADWRRAALDDIEAVKQRTIRQLEHVITEAFDQWERSKLDAVELVDEGLRPDGMNEAPGDDEEVIQSVEELIGRKRRVKRNGQCGDPRYLAQIKDALAERSKLLGLHAPTKTEHSGKVETGPPELTIVCKGERAA